MVAPIGILENALSFAYDEDLGYLASHPMNTGTGMRVSIMTQISGVSETWTEEQGADRQLSVRGSGGGQTDVVDSTYQISNLLLNCNTPTKIIEFFVEQVAGLLRDAQNQGSTD